MSRVASHAVQFLTIVYWWLAVVPAISVSPLCASIAAVLLGCGIVAYFFKLRFFAVLFYIPSVVLPLWITLGMWLLPAALFGLCFPPLIAFILLAPPTETPKFVPTEQRLRLPLRVYILLAVWLVGLLLFAFFPTENTPILFLAWTCAMLFSASREWGLFTNREWYGYKTRRDIFVSSRKWKMRFVLSALGIVAWVVLCYCILRLS
ncbi:MAG: hypothetical protein IJU23_14325 [Proteobacteria bacterium]|nr:hypothetical protein [Pseudomonadota bacterium]